MLDFMSQRPQCLSRNRKCLSCSACDAMLGRVRTLPPLRIGLLADATMAAGHRTSNPTRKRGSRGVMLHCMSHRPQCLSRNRKRLSRSACNAMLGCVRTLPPLRIGLLADAPMAADHRTSNPTRKRGSSGVMLNYIDPVHNAFRTIVSAYRAVRAMRC
jgi:hypothetical protein